MKQYTVNWNPSTVKPKLLEESILCCTEKGKLCVFKDTKGSYKKDGETVIISLWNRIKNDYKVKYWIYQKEIIPNELL